MKISRRGLFGLGAGAATAAVLPAAATPDTELKLVAYGAYESPAGIVVGVIPGDSTRWIVRVNAHTYPDQLPGID